MAFGSGNNCIISGNTEHLLSNLMSAQRQSVDDPDRTFTLPCVTGLCVHSLCVYSLCDGPVCVLPVCVLSVCVLYVCVLSVCVL